MDLGGGLTLDTDSFRPAGPDPLAAMEWAADTSERGKSLTVRLHNVGGGGHVDVTGTVEKTVDGFRITPID